jgi:hypothetical protein
MIDIFKNKWLKEFEKIKDSEEFIDFYIEQEDQWLQYADWDEKILGVFGSYKKAVKEFQNNISRYNKHVKLP